MNENQMKIIAESLVEASKLGTVNALTYVKSAFEVFKQLEIPVYFESVSKPYLNPGIKEFVDFIIVYLDEAIKGIDRKNEGE